MKTDFKFLLYFPCLRAGRLLPGERGHFAGGSVQKSFLVLAGHLWIRDHYLGGQFNKSYESSNNLLYVAGMNSKQ